MHCMWRLPPGDDDFSNRWKAIKIRFVRAIPRSERRSQVRMVRGERGVGQRRFREYVIRNDRDFARHVDYCYWNPVKHGLVGRVADWPFSTFHHYVKTGILLWQRNAADRGGHRAGTGAAHPPPRR
jgi:putative transposase